MLDALNHVLKETEVVAASATSSAFCAKAMSPTFMFGYDPSLTSVGAMPNGLATWRVQGNGEVRWILCNLADLLSALRVVHAKDSINMKECIDYVKQFTIESIEPAVNAGCQFFTVLQSSNSALFVPTGWMAVEKVGRGMVIYGVRKITITQSTLSHTVYEALIGAKKDANEMVSKHEEILKILMPPDI